MGALRYVPPLEPGFSPLIPILCRAADQRRASVVWAADGGTDEISFCCAGQTGARVYERLFKFLLWQHGGACAQLRGFPQAARRMIEQEYAPGGRRAFDYDFFSNVYGRPFSVSASSAPPAVSSAPRSRRLRAGYDGCRIGLDVGATAIKVWAGLDGRETFSQSYPWQPRRHGDLDYHETELARALAAAARTLPRTDSVGVSTAGIIQDSQCLVASLFTAVDAGAFKRRGRDLFVRAAKATGAARVVVCNDGDAAAAAAYVLYGKKGVLGLSMGSSLAAGFVDGSGGLTDYISELAFAPVDLQPGAPIDPWSGDSGTGVDYFSAQAVLRYAAAAGIEFEPGLDNGEKTARVNRLFSQGDARAKMVYDTIGICLGYSIPLYRYFYGMDSVLLLGGVTSGKAGAHIAAQARMILRTEFGDDTELFLPDERLRLTGQAQIVAALP